MTLKSTLYPSGAVSSLKWESALMAAASHSMVKVSARSKSMETRLVRYSTLDGSHSVNQICLNQM